MAIQVAYEAVLLGDSYFTAHNRGDFKPGLDVLQGVMAYAASRSANRFDTVKEFLEEYKGVAAPAPTVELMGATIDNNILTGIIELLELGKTVVVNPEYIATKDERSKMEREDHLLTLIRQYVDPKKYALIPNNGELKFMPRI